MEEKNSDIKIPKVTRTIQCVNSNDNTIMRSLVQTVSFYPTIIYDANDGELISVNYPDYKNFEKMKSPEIPGYTPNKESIPTEKIIYTSKNLIKKIKYAPIKKKTTINFIDKVTDSIMSANTYINKDNEDIKKIISKSIAAYEKKGYELNFNSFENSRLQQGEVYSITFNHKTTQFMANKHFNLETPLNPFYDKGPRVIKEYLDLKRKTTYKVKYLGVEDKNAPTDNLQIIDWDRVITADNVTGEIIQKTKWRPNKNKYEIVTTPVIKNYHADKKQSTGKNVVMDNIVEEIKYVRNGKIIPITENGTRLLPNRSFFYRTSETDPTKVEETQVLPNIPGYFIDQKTINIKNYNKDTKVIYATSNKNQKLVPTISFNENVQKSLTNFVKFKNS